MLCVLSVVCVDCCFVYNVLTHALVLQLACVLVPTVTDLRSNVVWLAFSNYECVDTHFPIGNKVHKIFNRNTVKVSYSCMSNVKSIITSHNTRIIRILSIVVTCKIKSQPFISVFALLDSGRLNIWTKRKRFKMLKCKYNFIQFSGV